MFIILIGSKSILPLVSQTHILHRYIKKQAPDIYKPTIGADFHSKKIEIPLGDEIKTVTLQVSY